MVAVEKIINNTDEVKVEIGKLLKKPTFQTRKEITELLKKLEGCTDHRMDEERTNWIINWLAVPQDQIDHIIVFLEKLWECGNFWPFLSVALAEQRINELKCEKLVRLSSTKPGNITVSFKHDSGRILHARYQFDHFGNGLNKTLRSVHDLSFVLCANHGGIDGLPQYIKM